jgi:hypothetical protein
MELTMKLRSLLIIAVLPLLSGCIARTALDVVSIPVKVASKSVDAITTSQSEADEKRGKQMREREERIGKLARKRDKLDRQCEDDRGACRDRDQVDAEIEAEMGRPL